MTTLLITHPAFLGHVTPPGHPERVERIRAVEQSLNGLDLPGKLARETAPLADDRWLTRVHRAPYIDALRQAAPAEGWAQIDADTVLSPGTIEAAWRAAGGACRAIDAVMTGTAQNAFVAARPPGHHAERAAAMGFCFLNNAAIAARHAQAAHGAGRVAIMDFDVHHGNGTQDAFWADKSVMYASTHQMPLYPGTGAAAEQGEHGTIVNAPLRAGDGGPAFRQAMEQLILRRLEAFQPDVLIISAGFDAHRLDPIGGLELTEEDFRWATLQLMDIARRHSGGRLISVLEGGYDLTGLARSAAAHVTALASA